MKLFRENSTSDICSIDSGEVCDGGKDNLLKC